MTRRALFARLVALGVLHWRPEPARGVLHVPATVPTKTGVALDGWSRAPGLRRGDIVTVAGLRGHFVVTDDVFVLP